MSNITEHKKSCCAKDDCLWNVFLFFLLFGLAFYLSQAQLDTHTDTLKRKNRDVYAAVPGHCS